MTTSFLDEAPPEGLYFINALNARTRREATSQYLATATFSEPRPDSKTVVRVLHHIAHPFSGGSIINREISTQNDGKIRKSVRLGQSDLLAERRNLELVAENTDVPVPRVYDWYKSSDFEHLVMERMPGETLEAVWSELSGDERGDIADQVVNFISQLRRLQSPTIDAALLDRKPLQAGLQNTLDFTTERIRGYTQYKPPIDYITPRCKPLQDLPNVFTHADLDWSNILILEKQVVGIIDLESSGHFPPYWEWIEVKRMAEGLPEGSWFRLLESRLEESLGPESAAMWEVEQLIQAMSRHSEWALTPDDRSVNRSSGWAAVQEILGEDVGPAPPVDYTPWSGNPWWLDNTKK